MDDVKQFDKHKLTQNIIWHFFFNKKTNTKITFVLKHIYLKAQKRKKNVIYSQNLQKTNRSIVEKNQ